VLRARSAAAYPKLRSEVRDGLRRVRRGRHVDGAHGGVQWQLRVVKLEIATSEGGVSQVAVAHLGSPLDRWELRLRPVDGLASERLPVGGGERPRELGRGEPRTALERGAIRARDGAQRDDGSLVVGRQRVVRELVLAQLGDERHDVCLVGGGQRAWRRQEVAHLRVHEGVHVQPSLGLEGSGVSGGAETLVELLRLGVPLGGEGGRALQGWRGRREGRLWSGRSGVLLGASHWWWLARKS
jgi:hypothetical protein